MITRHDQRSGRRHGSRSGSKTTKHTKITKKANLVFFVAFVFFVVLLPERGPRAAAQQPEQKPTEAQQRPVFRGGTHFVRVDAYPAQNGKIVEGLQADDFEILEDGKPQKIESFDFIRFEGLSPEAERRDPVSQQAGYDLAADPRYRLFVVYVDMHLSKAAGPFATMENLPHVQQPLVNFFERIVGPRDLYGFVTSRNSVKDLVLAQKTAVTVSQIKDLWRASVIDRDEADEVLGFCEGVDPAKPDDPMKVRFRADATYTNLLDLVRQLGSIRQERKNLVLATNLLPRWRPDQSLLAKRERPPVPQAGIERGRITSDDREIHTNAPRGGNANGCAGEFQRLAMMDFDVRFHELRTAARRENVSFYVITPGGLQAPPDLATTRAMRNAYDDLRSLADETDGIAVTDTNDLNAGFRRIADDLAAYYVLGYYTTNTNFDGRVRTIKVRYKATGKDMRARRQYRAPTRDEIAALAGSASRAAAPAGPSPVETALAVLERGSRPFAVYAAANAQQLTVVAELSAASIQAGKWKEGADVEVEVANAEGIPVAKAKGRIEPGAASVAVPVTLAPSVASTRASVRLVSSGAPADDWVKLPDTRGKLVADPIAYRSSSRSATRAVAAFDFARNERIRVEWPVLATLDRRDLRLLDRSGKPIPVELPLSEDPDKKVLVLDMSLSGLGRGDYLFELTAGAGSTSERSLIAIRIRQ